MTDRPIDFSSLDPTRDSAAFDALAHALADEAISARRGPRPDAVSELARWTRPALAAALVIAASATLALLSSSRSMMRSEPTVDAVGIPRAIVEWTHDNYQPSPVEVVSVLGHGLAGGAVQ